MGKTCYCIFCPNNSLSQSGITFFTLPLEPNSARLWMEQINLQRPSRILKGDYKICADHFGVWCFSNTFEKNRLVRGAIPFLASPPFQTQVVPSSQYYNGSDEPLAKRIKTEPAEEENELMIEPEVILTSQEDFCQSSENQQWDRQRDYNHNQKQETDITIEPEVILSSSEDSFPSEKQRCNRQRVNNPNIKQEHEIEPEVIVSSSKGDSFPSSEKQRHKGHNNENEFYYLGRTWENKLKKMSVTQQMFAMKAIKDVLLKGQMGELTRTSVQINKTTL